MNFNSSIGYATNTTLDPDGPDYKWMDRGKVISFENGGEGVNVIDPNVFVAGDGRVWLFYGSFQSGLRLVQLDPETGHLLNDPPDRTKITTSLGEGAPWGRRFPDQRGTVIITCLPRAASAAKGWTATIM